MPADGMALRSPRDFGTSRRQLFSNVTRIADSRESPTRVPYVAHPSRGGRILHAGSSERALPMSRPNKLIVEQGGRPSKHRDIATRLASAGQHCGDILAQIAIVR